ncbi:MAG: acyl carrier protein phosphodiesterase [Bacteroidota bacterium]|nr:acyl carrier protein phosphodiesterase [Bacteroidota bacterium]
MNLYLPPMNFLAHIYLSAEIDELKIGNFIADSVKGKAYLKFPEMIQNGIILHRGIDSFTDGHPIVRKSTHRLFPFYSHYSGVIVDIFYDHFLAANWQEFSMTPLPQYTAGFYELLLKNRSILPKRIQQFMDFMIADNWLLSYASLEGIQKVLQGMNRRTGRRSNMDQSIVQLKEFYKDFEEEFRQFFPELQAYSEQRIEELL